MLEQLSIKNYILIRELDLDLSDGFSAITGETGAGKSILIGALSLILGNRADTDVLLDKDSKCVIEGVFKVDRKHFSAFFNTHELDLDRRIMLRREINNHGKSRAFINDTPVKLPLMRELGEKLVDIHSQHQTLLLAESGFQLSILDDYAGNREMLQAYGLIFDQYIRQHAELQELKKRKEKLREEEDFTRFQHDELEHAALEAGESEQLEAEQEVLANAGEIKSNLFSAIQGLQMAEDNLIDRLSAITGMLGKVAGFHRDIAELNQRLQSAGIELKDIATSLSRVEEGITHDPDRLSEVEDRLNLILKLQQKHHAASIDELIGLREKLSDRLHSIENIDDDIDRLEKRYALTVGELEAAAAQLSSSRKAVVDQLQSELATILVRLGMEKVLVRVKVETTEELDEFGQDEVEFMFSANPGSPPAAVSKIASGGELSRIMLAMKSLLTKKNQLPTVILDEIDMGVSGEVASKVGKLLREMADNMQLIAITHLPQIAGKAREHFKVFKKFKEDQTVSGVIRLSDEERIEEIAAMMSNEKVSMAARETAKELLYKN